MNKFKLYFFVAALILSVFTPIYKQNLSDLAVAEESVNYVKEKWKNDIWGIVTDGVTKFKEKLFEEDKPKPKTKWDRAKEFITYGFGYGVNTIGGVESVIQNARYSFYPSTALITSFLLITLLLEVLLLIFTKRIYLVAFIGLIGIMETILLYGSTLNTYNNTSVVLWGWVFFLLVQLSLMIFFRNKQLQFNH